MQGGIEIFASDDWACVYMGGCQNYGPFGVPNIVRHLLFRVPKTGP